jgi:hypothetical protein
MVAQRSAHRGESSSVGCTGAEPCRFMKPVLATTEGWRDMGEGRHGRARRGKGREGAKNDASASLSAKAAACS